MEFLFLFFHRKVFFNLWTFSRFLSLIFGSVKMICLGVGFFGVFLSFVLHLSCSAYSEILGSVVW